MREEPDPLQLLELRDAILQPLLDALCHGRGAPVCPARLGTAQPGPARHSPARLPPAARAASAAAAPSAAPCPAGGASAAEPPRTRSGCKGPPEIAQPDLPAQAASPAAGDTQVALGDTTISLGSYLQCPATLHGKKLFLC